MVVPLSVVTLLGFVGLLLSYSAVAVILLLIAAIPAALAELRFSRATFELRNRRASDARLLGYLVKMARSMSVADDLLQHTFLKIHRVGERRRQPERRR